MYTVYCILYLRVYAPPLLIKPVLIRLLKPAGHGFHILACPCRHIGLLPLQLFHNRRLMAFAICDERLRGRTLTSNPTLNIGVHLMEDGLGKSDVFFTLAWLLRRVRLLPIIIPRTLIHLIEGVATEPGIRQLFYFIIDKGLYLVVLHPCCPCLLEGLPIVVLVDLGEARK